MLARRSGWRRALALAGVTAIAWPAAAQGVRAEQPETASRPPAGDAPPEAVAHYERGRDLFRDGRYKQAIVELKAALALDPSSPNLLYNVAYTSELLGNLPEAIEYYKRYLGALPPTESTEREKVQVTLRRLEGHLAERPAQTATQPAPATPSRDFGRTDLWFWASLGGGVALLGGGAVTGVMALQHEHELKSFVAGRSGSLAERRALGDDTRHLALASDIMTGAGAALVVTAALLFLLREPTAERAPPAPAAGVSATLVTGGRSAVLELHARF